MALYDWDKLLTEKDLNDLKKVVERKLQDKEHSLHVATRPRTVELEYRGVKFLVGIASFMEEFSLKARAFVKAVGVKQNMLQPLFCEDEMEIGELVFKGTLDKGLIRMAQSARSQASKFVEDESTSTSDEIKHALTKNGKVLAALDKDWKVELNFWLAQRGESGEVRLKRVILDAPPCVAHGPSFNTTVSTNDKAIECRLYKFVSPGLQSNATTILEMVSTLRDGRAPKIPSVAGSAFFTEVVQRLGYFCRATLADGKEVVGRGALEVRLAQARAKTEAKTLTLPDIRRLSQYGWLLSPEEVAELKGLTDDSLAKSSSGTPARASSSGGPGLLALARQGARKEGGGGLGRREA